MLWLNAADTYVDLWRSQVTPALTLTLTLTPTLTPTPTPTLAP